MNKYKSSISGEFIGAADALANPGTSQKVGRRDVYKDAKKFFKKSLQSLANLKQKAGKKRFKEIYVDFDNENQVWLYGVLEGGEKVFANLDPDLEKL